MTDPNPPAQPPPGQAAPGPHPHEMDAEELRVAAGDDPSVPEGVEPFTADGEAEPPDDPHTAEAGPHPHEATDHRRLGGDQRGLPEGVEPTPAPTGEGEPAEG